MERHWSVVGGHLPEGLSLLHGESHGVLVVAGDHDGQLARLSILLVVLDAPERLHQASFVHLRRGLERRVDGVLVTQRSGSVALLGARELTVTGGTKTGGR